MKTIKYIVVLGVMVLFNACHDCDEIIVEPCGEKLVNSEYCGWTVSTCFGGTREGTYVHVDPDAPVGVMYNTSINSLAPRGEDWGSTIQSIHPSNWISKEIGQIFGITMDKEDNIYLASSDIYYYDANWSSITFQSGNLVRPNPCGRIFKCSPPGWVATPFIDLPVGCDELNGIGNIAYDKWNNQIFASSLENGKIYQIDLAANILNTFDPWNADDGTAGIAPFLEQVWGIGLNYEEGIVKVYFAKNNPDETKSLYSVALSNGSFPINVSETVEISNIQLSHHQYPKSLISDIAFSSDGQTILISEHGHPHESNVISYSQSNGSWIFAREYFIGGKTSYSEGSNTAGGIDFGYQEEDSFVSAKCDALFYTTVNAALVRSDAIPLTGRLYGVQGINISGNNSSEVPAPTANRDTDIFIDYNGEYTTADKEIPGDVEVFDCVECLDPCSLKDFTN